MYTQIDAPAGLYGVSGGSRLRFNSGPPNFVKRIQDFKNLRFVVSELVAGCHEQYTVWIVN